MTIKYGFELEGFYVDNDTGEVTIPHYSLPADGFPGLVEFRTTGGLDLFEAYGSITAEIEKTKVQSHNVNTFIHEHKFTPEDMALLRKTRYFTKEIVDVQNVYGKKPRDNRGKTLASVQVNISNLSRYAQLVGQGKDKDRWVIPDQYNLLDIPQIIRNLDKAFEKEIKESGRQPGMYAIKNGYRLEYRSLPNFTWHEEDFLKRIKEAVEG